MTNIEYIGWCYGDVALVKNNSSICGSSNKTEFDQVYGRNRSVSDLCYRYYAETKKDSTICANIKNQEDEDGCYRLSKPP
jgi:hypothetical protein